MRCFEENFPNERGSAAWLRGGTRPMEAEISCRYQRNRAVHPGHPSFSDRPKGGRRGLGASYHLALTAVKPNVGITPHDRSAVNQLISRVRQDNLRLRISDAPGHEARQNADPLLSPHRGRPPRRRSGEATSAGFGLEVVDGKRVRLHLERTRDGHSDNAVSLGHRTWIGVVCTCRRH